MFYVALMGASAILVFIVMLAFYVVTSLGYMKALKQFGYPRAWFAWIPFARYYALADVAVSGLDNVLLFNQLSIPAMLYKFWWAVSLVAYFIPTIGRLIAMVIQVVFLGNTFVKLFARLDRTDEKSQQVLGYISGLIPFVAAIKFLISSNSKTF
jgi:hypothetical protein